MGHPLFHLSRLGKIVNKDAIRGEGMKKYFENARAQKKQLKQPSPPPPEAMEAIAEKASSLSLSGNRAKVY